nr:hypothetical protein CFP56_18322 [Quercus suber]
MLGFDVHIILEKLGWLLLQRLHVLVYLTSIPDADVPKNLLEVPSVSPSSPPLAAPAAPDLLLLADLPLVHKHIAIFENLTSTESGAHAPPSGLAQPPL